MNGWVDDDDDDDDVEEEEGEKNEDADIEEDDDAEIIFPYEKLAKKEVLLDLTHMERDRAEMRLTESIR
nr:hypothetical protein [Tanacetum cinerariifolium]